MSSNKINFFIWFFYKAGNKFRNFVFRKRLGRKEWSAKLIFSIMSFFGYFESRVYLNTGETGIFDHYVPRLLLKRWRADWDIGKTKGLPSDFVRKKLFAEVLESKASDIIRHINTFASLDLTFLEESTLAVFMSHQITRVPLFHDYLLRFFSIGYSNKLIDHSDFGNKEVLVRKVAHNDIGITYEQLQNGATNTRVEGGKPQRLLLSLIIASDIGEKIYRGNLHILEIPENSPDEFVVSDNPVVFLDFERQTILRFVPWWEIGEKDFWIFMPISPKKVIFYCKGKKKDGPIEKNNDSLVQLVNFGQYLSCSDNVFSQQKSALERHLKLYEKELIAQNK
ncbi:MAG: hypothetical protein UW01_C0008G0020 [Candidatus Nomurabacteria bacterium GW2011_GWA2_43_66]|nr:MAG: hypothetical protein UW01_C0008G0020 [Candidatus Nomurabacteria bacterium GW2011_GWA2_43_66]